MSATLSLVDTTSQTALTDLPGRPPARAVAVDVADPDVDADVRAVLAALALDVARRDGSPADVLVTDRPRVGAALGGARLVRVASDQAPDDDDDDDVVRLPSGTADLVGALMAPVPGRSGRLLAVVGAVGGCGTSTLAAALGVRAAAGPGPYATATDRTLLVEADRRGTGIDLVLGAEDRTGLRVEDVRAELGGPDPDALWGAVPAAMPALGVLARDRRARVAGGVAGASSGNAAATATAPAPAPSTDGALGAALAHRGAGGLVVCDAGGFAGDDPVLAAADLVVVVARADLAGAVAAGRAVSATRGAALVVRTRRGDALHAADVAESVGTASWHVLPEIGAVRRASGAGELGAALARGRAGRVRRLAALADTLLESVAR